MFQHLVDQFVVSEPGIVEAEFIEQTLAAQQVPRGRSHALDQVDQPFAIRRRLQVVLLTPSGMPWKADHFRHAWAAASKEAGITDLHFHDLRETTFTILSEQGASPEEIAAITGHSLTTVAAILDKYSGRTLPLAEMAMAKLEKGPAGTFGEQIQQNASKTAKRRPTKKDLTA
jgi:hypothetical protein